ncbi:MAG: META domain-containing protein [Thermomicrobiales bacterium]
MDACRIRCRHLVGCLLLVAMLAGSACGPDAFAAPPSPEAGEAPVLAYTSWRLVEMQTGPNSASQPGAGEMFSLVFGEGDAVTVTTDCATAVGTIAIRANHDVVPNLTVTGASTCERRSLPERFLNNVNLAGSWVFDDDGMLVLNLAADGGFIRLEQTLTGTTWRWTGFQGGDGETAQPEADAPTTMVFGTDGVVTLTAPCGTMMAPYALDGARGLLIDTSALPASSDPCMNGTRLTLGAMRSYVFRDGKLFISLMADGGIHTFEATAPAT